MAAKFTTGSPPLPYVKDQIEFRQDILGRRLGGNEGKTILNLLNNRSVFARISSAISIDSLIEIDNAIETAKADGNEKKAFTYESQRRQYAAARLANAGFTEEFITQNEGRELARNFIIQGTVLKRPFEDVKNDQGGVIETKVKGDNPLIGGVDISSPFQGHYGWGSVGTGENNTNFQRFGSGFGYSPIPGITSLTVKHLNKGAVVEAAVNVKLYNKQQFQLFDLLYLRPGYSILIEFGWTKYGYRESSGVNAIKVENADFNTPAFNHFFSDNVNKETLYQDIESHRRTTHGNYDGVFGLISNFDWTFNEDGTYDCTIKVYGYGSVIDGLVINSQSGGKLNLVTSTTYVETVVTGDEDTEGETTEIETTLETQRSDYTIESADKSALGAELYNIITQQGGSNFYQQNNRNVTFKNYYLTDFKTKEGERFNLYFPNGLASISVSKRTIKEGETDDNITNPVSYMLFGAFLALLQSRYLLYSHKKTTNNNNPANAGNEDQPIPITSFDFNFVDRDPGDGVPLPIKHLKKELTIAGKEPDVTTEEKNNILYYKDGLNNDLNFMLTAPGVFSADPTVCFTTHANFTNEVAELGMDAETTSINDEFSGVKKDKSKRVEVKNARGEIEKVYVWDKIYNRRPFAVDSPSFFKDDGNGNLIPVEVGDRIQSDSTTTVGYRSFLARISNIYVNINLLSRLAGQASAGQSLDLGSFMNNLLQEIQGAYGSINSLRTEVTQDGIVRIRDLVPTIDHDTVTVNDPLVPTVNVYGIEGINNNQLRNQALLLGTDSNNLANLADVAQGGSFVKKFNINGNVPKDLMNAIIIGATAEGNSITANATGLSGYNRGLTDFVKQNVRSELEDQVSSDKVLADMWNNRVKTPYDKAYSYWEWTSENLNKMKESAKTFFPLLLGTYSNKGLVNADFLPFDMSMELDGLGGFQVFNSVRVKETILPVSYQDKGTRLMLSGIDQAVDESGWKTTLSCLSYSSPELQLGTSFQSQALSLNEIKELYHRSITTYYSDYNDATDTSACPGKKNVDVKLPSSVNNERRLNYVDFFRGLRFFGIENSLWYKAYAENIKKECGGDYKDEVSVRSVTDFNYGTQYQWYEEHFTPIYGPRGVLARRNPALDTEDLKRQEHERFIAKTKEYFVNKGKIAANIYFFNYIYGPRNDSRVTPELHAVDDNLLDPELGGWKWRGRGLIQSTGPGPYKLCDKILTARGITNDSEFVQKNPEILHLLPGEESIDTLGYDPFPNLGGITFDNAEMDNFRLIRSICGVIAPLQKICSWIYKDGGHFERTGFIKDEILEQMNCINTLEYVQMAAMKSVIGDLKSEEMWYKWGDRHGDNRKLPGVKVKEFQVNTELFS